MTKIQRLKDEIENAPCTPCELSVDVELLKSMIEVIEEAGPTAASLAYTHPHFGTRSLVDKINELYEVK